MGYTLRTVVDSFHGRTNTSLDSMFLSSDHAAFYMQMPFHFVFKKGDSVEFTDYKGNTRVPEGALSITIDHAQYKYMTVYRKDSMPLLSINGQDIAILQAVRNSEKIERERL